MLDWCESPPPPAGAGSPAHKTGVVDTHKVWGDTASCGLYLRPDPMLPELPPRMMAQ